MPAFYRVVVHWDEDSLAVDFGDIRTALERLIALARHYPEQDVLFYRLDPKGAWELDRGRCWLRHANAPQTDAA